jgi:hypothetical protein
MPRSFDTPLPPAVLRKLGIHGREFVASELRSLGIWPGDVEHSYFVRERQMRGPVLWEQLLPACLGSDERMFLNAPHFSSERNGLRWSRSANLLTFGYEVARAFSLVRRWYVGEHSGPAISALLNFGFAMFDKQCDRAPKGSIALLTHFDSSTLRSLCQYSEAARELRARSNLVKDSELRILLKVISAIFLWLHQVRPVNTESASEWSVLTDWMSCSFDAQIGTLISPSEQQVEIKSIGPLQIIFSVMRLTRPLLSTAGAEMESQFATELSRAIWLVDDIADMEKDGVSGSANSILLAARAHDGAYNCALQDCLLKSCNVAIACIKTVSDTLLRCHPQASVHIERTLLSYIRSWLT